MPAFNAREFIEEAIASVLNQQYSRWELIIINDGSTDDTEKIILKFTDKRIKYLKTTNKGVSSARNNGLLRMKGDFFCFLDADDTLTPQSIKARVRALEDNATFSFIDGFVLRMDGDLAKVRDRWKPSFFGNPFEDLVRLTGMSFFGNSWMIRRKPDFNYTFREGLTHCEDLLFYMEIAKNGGLYFFIEEDILRYRMHGESAMKNLDGLSNGYREVYEWLKTQRVREDLLGYYQQKVNRIITRSYLRAIDPIKAIKKRLI
jgi:teichuronic acid biosynthesis glycosyltransferase TuaG